jgi:hypothetical protein
LGTDRRLVLFVKASEPDTNVFVVFTPIRGDYTAVSSFGTIDDVRGHKGLHAERAR